MAETIRGINVIISGETTGLTKALEDVNKKSKAIQGELKQIEKLLKFDPSNTELLAQKQKLLADAVANAQEKLDRLRAVQEQVNEQFRRGEISEGQYRAFQREVIKTEQELQKLQSRLKEMEPAVRTIGDRFREVGEKIKAAGERMTEVGEKLQKTGRNIAEPFAAAGAAIGAGLGFAVKTAADFEAQMDRVGAIAGASTDELKAMEQAALDLGASTSKSASEVAQGMELMAAMGYNATQIIAAMPGVIAAAEASGEDMALVAETVAAALNSFGLEAAEASRVADVLAQSANMSAAGVRDMQYAFKYAAPVANALGISLEELAAAVAIMSNAGIRGEQAGTTLRAALIRLSDPPKEAANALKELGVSITDAQGNMLPFGDIIAQLTEKTANMSNAQKLAALSTIFGTEAASGMLTVIEAGPAVLEEFTTSLENSAGAAKKASEQMKDNLKGALEELGGSIETAQVSIGNILIPLIREVAEFVKQLVDRFNSLSPEMQKFITYGALVAGAVTGVIAAFGLLVVAVGSVISAFGTITTALGGLSIGLSALTGPVGIAIAAVAGLIAVGVALYKNWDEIKKKASQIWGAIKETIDSIIAGIKNAISGVVSAGKDIVSGIWEGIKSMGSWLYEKVAAFVNDNIVGTVKKFLGIASPSKVMAEFGRYVAEGLAAGIQDGTSKVSEQAQKMAQAISGAVQIMTGELSNALSLSNARFELQKELLGDNADEVQKLTLELQRLIAEKENLAAKVDVLSAAYEMSKKKLGENNETTKQYAYELEMAQIELQKMEVSIRKTSVAIEEQKKKAIEAARQQAQELRNLADEVTNVEKKYREDLAAAAEEYQKKVQEVNNKLIEDERRVQAEYEKTLDDRARALRDFVGLFDEVTSKDVSGEQLLKNLRGQVEAFENWQKNIAELAARGVDEGLIEELRQMGPKAGPEIAALNTLTDEQLTEYVALWQEKNQAAREEAVNQLQQQRIEMQQKLMEIRMAAYEQLEQYRIEWEKKNAEIRKNAEEEMKRIEQRFKEISEAGSKYGISLMTNFIGGIESRFEQLRQTLENMAAMVDSYMPHSPAKRGPLSRIMEWGPALVDSLVDGIRRSLPKLESIMESMANIPSARAVPILAGGSNTTYNYNTGGNTIHITVQDGEDLLRTLHRLGVRLP